MLGAPLPPVRPPVALPVRSLDDLPVGDGLWGTAVVAPVAGRLRRVRFGDGVDWREVTIVSAGDLPGANRLALETEAGAGEAEPILAGDDVRYRGQPVLLLAAGSRGLLCRAVDQVELEIEPAREPSAGRIVGEDRFGHGALGVAVARAVTGEYLSAPQAAHELVPPVARVRLAGARLEVEVPTAAGERLRAILGRVSGRDPATLRVRSRSPLCDEPAGSDRATIDAVHATLLALAAGSDVKLVHVCRPEPDAQGLRHGAATTVTVGLDVGGRLAVLDLACDLDTGAFPRGIREHLARAVLAGAGPYGWTTVRVRVRARTSAAAPRTAHDAAAAPAVVARERHLDRLARAAGDDPRALRRRSLPRPAVLDALGEPGEAPDGVALGGDLRGLAAAVARVVRCPLSGSPRLAALRLAVETTDDAAPTLRRLILREVGWALGLAAPRAVDVPRVELVVLSPPAAEGRSATTRPGTATAAAAGVVAAAIHNAMEVAR